MKVTLTVSAALSCVRGHIAVTSKAVPLLDADSTIFTGRRGALTGWTCPQKTISSELKAITYFTTTFNINFKNISQLKRRRFDTNRFVGMIFQGPYNQLYIQVASIHDKHTRRAHMKKDIKIIIRVKRGELSPWPLVKGHLQAPGYPKNCLCPETVIKGLIPCLAGSQTLKCYI